MRKTPKIQQASFKRNPLSDFDYDYTKEKV